VDERIARLERACQHESSVANWIALAQNLERTGALPRAASAYDRAYGLAPEDPDVSSARARVLDQLAVNELGMVFRFVPGGPFQMGSERGDPDERPVHEVELSPFWIADSPISLDRWAWLRAMPHPKRRGLARLWDVFQPGEAPRPKRDDAQVSPASHVTWREASGLVARMNRGAEGVLYRLPTEAEWEKAARGGWVGEDYSWGTAPPHPTLLDADPLIPGGGSARPPGEVPPNGYGLHAMCGGVWEWTGDLYDATFYATSPRQDPQGPNEGRERVLRGGSWVDCQEACTVSFRWSRPPNHRTTARSPTVGMRVVRVETDGATTTSRPG
jgi:formylglycine-generating enzyme